MKCKKCGNELNDTDLYCNKCGSKVNENNEILEDENIKSNVNENDNIVDENKEEKVDYKRANILTLVSAFLIIFFPNILNEIFKPLNTPEDGLFLRLISGIIRIVPFIGIALLVYIRITYPKHIISRIFCILLVVGLIIYLVFTIFIIATCINAGCEALQDCSG